MPRRHSFTTGKGLLGKLGLRENGVQHDATLPGGRLDQRLLLLLRARPLTASAVAAALLFLLLRRSSHLHGHGTMLPADHLLCNPYDQPGYFSWTPDRAHEGKWTPFLNATQGGCADGPDWIMMLQTMGTDLGQRPPPPPEPPERDPHAEARERWRAQDTAFANLDWLKNRTILVVGDSVDRNSMDHLGYFAKSNVHPTDYRDASFRGQPPGWDVRGVPHVVNIHRLDTQVANVFYYGIDDEDAFSKQVDWHAPGKAEDRLYDLFMPFTAQLKHPVSFIQIHSGMWDLALFGRQDAIKGASTEHGIDPARIRWWMARMRSIIAHFREAYPGVPIWFRTLHRVGTLIGKGSEDYIRGVERAFDAKRQNFFTDLRCGQIREMQIAVAKELCLPINDFGRWWEGYQAFQDKVHPNPLPGGLVYVNPLLHSIWLESQGRQNWETKPCHVGWDVDDQIDNDMGR